MNPPKVGHHQFQENLYNLEMRSTYGADIKFFSSIKIVYTGFLNINHITYFEIKIK